MSHIECLNLLYITVLDGSRPLTKKINSHLNQSGDFVGFKQNVSLYLLLKT